MKKLLIVLAAAAALGAAAPASAQGVGVQVGPFGFGVGPDYWGYRHYYDPYAYGGDCRTIRERIVTPSGRVILRTREVCD